MIDAPFCNVNEEFAVRRTYRHLPAGRVRLPDAYLAGRRTVKAAAALTVRRAGRYSSPVSVE
jgi:hypothetical protein